MFCQSIEYGRVFWKVYSIGYVQSSYLNKDGRNKSLFSLKR